MWSTSGDGSSTTAEENSRGGGSDGDSETKQRVLLWAILFSVGCTLLTFGLAYEALLFYLSRHDFGLRNRKSNMTLTAVTATIAWCWLRVWVVWIDAMDWWGDPRPGPLTCVIFYSLFSYSSILIASSTMILRLWIIFYDVNLALAEGDTAWIKLVTGPISREESTFRRVYFLFQKKKRNLNGLAGIGSTILSYSSSNKKNHRRRSNSRAALSKRSSQRFIRKHTTDYSEMSFVPAISLGSSASHAGFIARPLSKGAGGSSLTTPGMLVNRVESSNGGARSPIVPSLNHGISTVTAASGTTTAGFRRVSAPPTPLMLGRGLDTIEDHRRSSEATALASAITPAASPKGGNDTHILESSEHPTTIEECDEMDSEPVPNFGVISPKGIAAVGEGRSASLARVPEPSAPRFDALKVKRLSAKASANLIKGNSLGILIEDDDDAGHRSGMRSRDGSLEGSSRMRGSFAATLTKDPSILQLDPVDSMGVPSAADAVDPTSVSRLQSRSMSRMRSEDDDTSEERSTVDDPVPAGLVMVNPTALTMSKSAMSVSELHSQMTMSVGSPRLHQAESMQIPRFAGSAGLSNDSHQISNAAHSNPSRGYHKRRSKSGSRKTKARRTTITLRDALQVRHSTTMTYSTSTTITTRVINIHSNGMRHPSMINEGDESETRDSVIIKDTRGDSLASSATVSSSHWNGPKKECDEKEGDNNDNNDDDPESGRHKSSTVITKELAWFVANKVKYGTVMNLAFPLSLIALVFFIITVSLVIANQSDYVNVVFGIWLLSIVSCVVYIGWHYPSFDDGLLIYKELLFICVVSLMFVAGFISFGIIEFVHLNNDSSFWFRLWQTIFNCIYCSLLVLAQTEYVLYLFRSHNTRRKQALERRKSMSIHQFRSSRKLQAVGGSSLTSNSPSPRQYSSFSFSFVGYLNGNNGSSKGVRCCECQWFIVFISVMTDFCRILNGDYHSNNDEDDYEEETVFVSDNDDDNNNNGGNRSLKSPSSVRDHGPSVVALSDRQHHRGGVGGSSVTSLGSPRQSSSKQGGSAAEHNSGHHSGHLRMLSVTAGQALSRVARSVVGRDSVALENWLHSQSMQQILFRVIRGETSFRLFMKHLFKEFSYESLLCVFEMIQFRRLVQKQEELENEERLRVILEQQQQIQQQQSRNVNPNTLSVIPAVMPVSGVAGASDSTSTALGFTPAYLLRGALLGSNSASFPLSLSSDIGDSGGQLTEEDAKRELESLKAREKFFGLIQFPPSVEAEIHSTIVFSEDLSNEQKFLALTDKYVNDTAELCVNISFHCRKDLMTLADEIVDDFANFSHSAVFEPSRRVRFTVFDKVIKQLVKLMCDSLERFRGTEAFDSILEDLVAPGEELDDPA